MATGGTSPLQAVVIGGTGAIGRCLVGELLKAKDKVSKVTVLGRRKVDSVAEVYGVDITAEESSGRLVQHAEDLDEVSDETVKGLCTGSQVFFNCMGSTRRQAGSADAFRHIDCEIPVRLMKLARQAGVTHCSVVSSVGANPRSWFLYLETKGRIEETVRSMEFPTTSIYRPGLLDRGGTKRFGEKLVGLFSKGMPVSTVARAMLHDAWITHTTASTTEEKSYTVFGNNEINRIYQESTAEK